MIRNVRTSGHATVQPSGAVAATRPVITLKEQPSKGRSIRAMNSLTNTLKSEIARVARKELKDELLALRKTATAHRSEIAALKREIRALQSQLKANRRTLDKLPAPAPASDAPPERKLRFSAEAFAAQRARLGLTQVQMARLLGASTLSVYKWETGKVHPRAAQLERIAAVRKLGKREVAARLAEA